MNRIPARRTQAAHREGRRSAWPDRGNSAQTAFVKVAQQRFAIFIRRFGRQPALGEPLLFDPRADSPICASPGEMRAQVIAAARAANVSPDPVLEYLGLKSEPLVAGEAHEH
jgi:hypothetical protein